MKKIKDMICEVDTPHLWDEMHRIYCRSDRLDTKKVKINPGCLPVSTFLYSRVFKLDSSSAPILFD